jgi:twitching motility protein PilT
MQHCDGEIEKLVRAGTVDLEKGLSYATNPGNLRLQLADMSEDAAQKQMAKPVAQQSRAARPLPPAVAGHPARMEKPKAMPEPELELEVER